MDKNTFFNHDFQTSHTTFLYFSIGLNRSIPGIITIATQRDLTVCWAMPEALGAFLLTM